MNFAARHASAGGNSKRGAIAAGHKWIGAVINVKQASVGALEQNSFASFHRVVQTIDGVLDVRPQSFTGICKALGQRIGIKWRRLHAKRLQFLGAQTTNHAQAFLQIVRVQQIAHANSGGAVDLVAVGRTNAAASCSNGQTSRVVLGDAG